MMKNGWNAVKNFIKVIEKIFKNGVKIVKEIIKINKI